MSQRRRRPGRGTGRRWSRRSCCGARHCIALRRLRRGLVGREPALAACNGNGASARGQINGIVSTQAAAAATASCTSRGLRLNLRGHFSAQEAPQEPTLKEGGWARGGCCASCSCGQTVTVITLFWRSKQLASVSVQVLAPLLLWFFESLVDGGSCVPVSRCGVLSCDD